MYSYSVLGVGGASPAASLPAFALSRYSNRSAPNHYQVNDASVIQTTLDYVRTIWTNIVRDGYHGAISSHAGSSAVAQ